MSTRSGEDVLGVRFSRHRQTVVLHLAGDLDGSTAPVLRHALAGIIEDQGNLAVRLDLREMTFIDSTGLSVLVGPPGGDFERRAVTSPWPTSGRRR